MRRLYIDTRDNRKKKCEGGRHGSRPKTKSRCFDILLGVCLSLEVVYTRNQIVKRNRTLKIDGSMGGGKEGRKHKFSISRKSLVIFDLPY